MRIQKVNPTYKNSKIMFNTMFNLCALLITICVVAGNVQSGPTIPDGQQKAIVVAIIVGGDQHGTKLINRVYCPEYDNPDCLKGVPNRSHQY